MIFDSSAIIAILQIFRGKAVSLFEGKFTLGLALYELGNVIWKECVLRGKFKPNEAMVKIGKLTEVVSVMNVENLETKEDLAGVMELAVRLKLTFYDASYLYMAKKLNLILVTEDEELKRKAEKAMIKAKTVREISE